LGRRSRRSAALACHAAILAAIVPQRVMTWLPGGLGQAESPLRGTRLPDAAIPAAMVPQRTRREGPPVPREPAYADKRRQDAEAQAASE
jgi:hypothetical protein